jgi:hypothetical protein
MIVVNSKLVYQFNFREKFQSIFELSEMLLETQKFSIFPLYDEIDPEIVGTLLAKLC